MNWKLTLSYDGTAFHGWQIQPTLPTIQRTLADALHFVTGETTLPQGSGRTDAGVHALAQVCSFQLESPIPAPNLLLALNRALPPSIRILSADLVPETFHARHSALRKTYEYRLFLRRPLPIATDLICSPFLAPYVWDCRWPLNLDLLHAAATSLLGTHNFTSFAASDPDITQRNAPDIVINPTKTIYHSAFSQEDDVLIYTITGSGFLHHMVRNIIGTLVDIGRGALPPNSIPQILTLRDRTAAGPTAPPNGLFLHSVDYGDAS